MSKSPSQYYASSPEGAHMRPSRVLRKIRNGEVATCFKINLADPRAYEIVSMTGFDCIWLCTEHTPTNYADAENLVRAAKIYDTDILYRCPRGAYSDYIRGFEMDAAGLMVPHVMSPDDAADVVRMTKFPPVGRRAVDGGNADGGYCRYSLADYLKQANEDRFVIHQIEDPEALEHIEAIAALPGVDGLLFGPGDYSVAIGKPGQVDDPEIWEVRERVAKAARANGKIAAATCGPAMLQRHLDLGFNFINMGADVIGLAAYAADIHDAFKAAGVD